MVVVGVVDKVVIWDFDGTLAYRDGMWSGALAEVARRAIPGCCATREDFIPHLQTGFFWHAPDVPHTHIQSADEWWDELAPVFARAFVAVLSVSDARARELAPAVRAAFIDPRAWRVFDDVRPCLDALSAQGWRHAILSNHVPELPGLIDALGLSRYVTDVFNSATLGYEKPHANCFAAVRAAFAAAPALWMIGDNFNADIKGAAAAEIPGILVRKPHAEAVLYHETLQSIPRQLAGALANR